VKDARVPASLASHREISIGLLETINGIQYGGRRYLEARGRVLWRGRPWLNYAEIRSPA